MAQMARMSQFGELPDVLWIFDEIFLENAKIANFLEENVQLW